VSSEQEAQQANLNGLMQRYLMAEQQRQMQHQQALQQTGQTSEPAGSSYMHSSQHMMGSQAFSQQQGMRPGQMIGKYAI